MKRIEYKNLGETLYTETLENGLPVFVVPKAGFGKKFAYFITRYGGSDRRFVYDGEWIDTPAGIAHFLEHKLFETEDGNAMNTLSRNGATANAYTSSNVTAYHFECIDLFEENLRTLLSFVSVPYFTKESVDREQGIIGREICMIEDQPNNRLYYNLMKSLYAHNPIRESVGGSVESIAKITAETLYSCHKVFYNPANMALCVIGDVDPELVVKAAKEVLPKEKGGPGERDYGSEESLEPVKKEFREAMPVSMPSFLFGCKVKPAPNGQELARQQLTGELALRLIAGGSSTLYSRLYIGGLIRGFGASLQYYPDGAFIGFGGDSPEPEKVVDEVKKEIEAFVQNGPDQNLFTRLKKSMTGEYLSSLDSFNQIAGGLALSHFSGYSYFESFDMLHEITLDQIWTFAKENLVIDRFALSVIHP